MKTDFYKDGKLVYSHEHENGVAFDSVKETIGKIMCQMYPGVDEAITTTKTKGAFRTRLILTQTNIK